MFNPVKKAGAKRSTTYIEGEYDLETTDNRKRKVLLTIQQVKAVDPQHALLPETPPRPETPPPQMQTDYIPNRCSFRICNGLLPVALLEECQDAGCKNILHHICQINYESKVGLDLPMMKRCYACVKKHLPKNRPPTPPSPEYNSEDEIDLTETNQLSAPTQPTTPSLPPLPPLPTAPSLPPSPPLPSSPSPSAQQEGNEEHASTVLQPPSPQNEQHEECGTESPCTVECHGVTWEMNTRKMKREINLPKVGRGK